MGRDETMSREAWKKGLKQLMDLWERGGQEAVEKVIKGGQGIDNRDPTGTVDK